MDWIIAERGQYKEWNPDYIPLVRPWSEMDAAIQDIPTRQML